MVDASDVRTVASSLPGVTEDELSFRVNGVLFAWPYPERVHPKKARVPRTDIFVLLVADQDDKQALLEGEPDIFFTTAHYDGSAMLMVRLEEIDRERFTELLTDAHAAGMAKSTKRRKRT